MTNDNQQPDEPGWNHRPGDPDDTERWWTGADWSEYTRPTPQQGSNEAEMAAADAMTDTQAVVEISETDAADADAAAIADAVTDADVVADADAVVDATGGADDPSVTAAQDTGVAESAESSDPPPPSWGSASIPATPAEPAAASYGSMPPSGAVDPAGAGAAPPGVAAQGAEPIGPVPDAENPPSVFAGLGGGGIGGFLERIRADADSSESGWDRNLATFPWLPLLGGISLLAYALSGSQLSRNARSHIMGSINYFISMLILGYFMWTIWVAGQTNIGLGLFWWLVLGAAFAGVVYLLSKRNADGVGPVPYWVWFGVWAVVALMAATLDFGIVAYGAVFFPLQFFLALFNLVRGRIGMNVNFLGYPVVPILSQR